MSMLCRLTGFLALTLLSTSSCSPSAPSPPEAEIANRGPSFAYRMKADFILKETGEPVSFDYVVACNYTSFENRHTTDTTFAALTPVMMFQPVGNGHAVGIVTIDMCEGSNWSVQSGPNRGNSVIPDDLRPLAIWFEDIHDLSKGWGYKTDSAYESPLAKLQFIEAHVEVSDEAAWETWRERATEEYEAEGALPGPFGLRTSDFDPRETPGYGYADPSCLAQGVATLKPEWVERLFAVIPDKSAQFLSLHEIGLSDPELWLEFMNINAPVFADGKTWRHYRAGTLTDSLSRYGTLSRDDGGHIPRDTGLDGTTYHETYPILPRSVTMAGTASPQDEYFRVIMTAPEYDGFGFCNSGTRPLDRLHQKTYEGVVFGKAPTPPFDPDGLDKKHTIRIKGELVFGRLEPLRTSIQQPVIIIARDGRVFFPDQ